MLLEVIRTELLQHQGRVRRRAPQRDPRQRGRPRHPRPDRAGRRGGHAVACRLRQAPAGQRLSRAAPRRPRPQRRRDQGRGFHRPAVAGQHPRHPADLHQRRPRVLAAGVPVARSRFRMRAAARSSTGSRWKPASRCRRCCRCANTTRASSCSSPPQDGTVKKTPLTEFAYRLQRGKIAINLDEGDALVGVALTDGSARHDAVRLQRQGRALRREARCARWAAPPPACAACAWPRASEVRSLIVVDGDGDILTASERGYGKRTPVDEYPRKGRGTQGVIALQTTDAQRQAGRRDPAAATTTKCC